MRFPYANAHHCAAVVIMCMDFRFHKAACTYLRKEAGIKEFDLVAFPGAAKMIIEEFDACAAKKSVEISTKLHHASNIVIINHADCGAYGGRKAFKDQQEEEQKHTADLIKSIQIMQGLFPRQKCFGVYVDLDPKKEQLEFKKIESLNLLQKTWPTLSNYVPV